MNKLGWTYLNFQKRQAFTNTGDIKELYGSIPANSITHKLFINNFLAKGQKSCTFKELKQYVQFDGRSAATYSYGTLNITIRIFRLLFEYIDDDNDFEKAFNKMSEKIRAIEEENKALKKVDNEVIAFLKK